VRLVLRNTLRYGVEVLPLPFTAFFVLLATVVITAPAHAVWSRTPPERRAPVLPACLELPPRLVPPCLILWR
jgi:hypothetical protein